MTSADDRRREDEDIWAQAVAEGAEAVGDARTGGSGPADETGEPLGGSGSGSGAGAGEDAPSAGQWGDSDLGPLVEEVRRFTSAVGEKVQQAARTLSDDLGRGGGLDRFTEPLRERHPEVYQHLAAAGGELLAAYRAAVSGHERRWTAGKPSRSEHIDLD